MWLIATCLAGLALLVIRHCIRAGGFHYALPMVDFKGKSLRGQTILVTGGTSGIGLETVKTLHALGARLFIGSHNERERLRVLSVLSNTKEAAPFQVLPLDLMSATSIITFVEAVLKETSSLDQVIQCAGVNGATAVMFQVNFIGPIRLTQLLLNRNINSRFIYVASDAHEIGRFDRFDFSLEQRFGYLKSPTILDFWAIQKSYGSCKLQLIMYIKQMLANFPESTFNFVQPGAVCTPMGEENAGPVLVFVISILKKFFLKSAFQGAQTVLYLALIPELRETGQAWASNARWKFWNSQIHDERAREENAKLTDLYLKQQQN